MTISIICKTVVELDKLKMFLKDNSKGPKKYKRFFFLLSLEIFSPRLIHKTFSILNRNF